jgi:hypothetical protein
MGAGKWHRREAAAAAAAFVALGAFGAAAGGARQASFTTSDAPLPKRIYDLGVAYVGADPDPDLFTTAHNNRQVVLIGDGGGGFDNEISALDLDHTPAFPGLEAIDQAPTLDDPGLYLFYRHDGLRLIAHGVTATGTLRSRAFRRAEARDGATAVLEAHGNGDLPSTRVDYTMPPGSRVDVKMVPVALPVRVHRTSASPVFVGSQGTVAGKERFSIQVRDRHGMAWTDADADGDTDVFIARGGLAGRIKGHRNLVQDELMLQSAGTFDDFAEQRHLRKGRCRAREAIPLDADGDGRTDLSTSCEEGVVRLFLRRGPRYANASGQLKRAGARGSAIEWVDLRGGLTPEVVTFDDGGLRVFERGHDGSWALRQRITGLPRGEVVSIASADFDNDGDADVLASARAGLTLLRNRHGELVARTPPRMGLPARAEGPVVWIDYQNDGLLDLYAPPGGIYEQRPQGGFAASGLLATGNLTQARSVWMDVDGDGDRDGVLTARDDGKRFSSLFKNELTGDHWLEVEVEGRGGARDAPGARVRIDVEGAKQTGWVGQSDSSRFSAGDHRLYFGLGDENSVDLVTVRWTDGETRTLTNVADNQLLRVERP